jgi:hypothetical protein
MNRVISPITGVLRAGRGPGFSHAAAPVRASGPVPLREQPALGAAILDRARRDIAILENPLYSDRSPEIDAMRGRWGIPPGGCRCALWAATIWADAGAEVPPIDPEKGWHPADPQSWYEWALQTGRFGSRPAIGCAVLYGACGRPPARHMGAAIVAVTPFLLDVAEITSACSPGRAGELSTVAVDLEHLIGYVHPLPL